MFRDARFNHPINNWDVSNVENMSGMFSVWHREDNPFNQEIGEWDVSSVTNMSLMFNGSVFNQDISNWDVSMLRIWLPCFLASHMRDITIIHLNMILVDGM